MKHLYIIRHGKALTTSGRDFDRPLTSRGKSDAESLANLLHDELDQHIHQAISAAVRTQETAQIIFHHLGMPSPDTIEAAYLAPAPFWLEQVSKWQEPYDQGVLIGHNPGLSELILALTGESVWLPTCGMARVTMEIDTWEEASRGLGTLDSIWTPKG